MIGILGHNGFVGKNLQNYFEKNDIKYAISLGVDARLTESISKWIDDNGIKTIVNLAAKCGGIGLNKKHPFKLWLDNTKISTAVLEASIEADIEKLVMVGTVCSYAENCPTPFKEDYLMNYGFPEPTNRAYGLSKLNSLIGAQAANIECGVDVVNLIPVNMYGPYDDFNLSSSHVIPALIKKMHDSISNNDDEIIVWGTGKAHREFLYVEDFCECILESILSKSNNTIMNVGTGNEIMISELVDIIKDHMNFNGKIIWDDSKPDGQLRRRLDVTLIQDTIGWKHKTNFEDGLNKTVKWFLDNMEMI